MEIFTYYNKRSRRKFYSREMECILMSLLPIGRRDNKFTHMKEIELRILTMTNHSFQEIKTGRKLAIPRILS